MESSTADFSNPGSAPASRPSRLRLTAIILGIVGGASLLWAFEPGPGGLFPPCPFRALTGWKCPGCGSLRALHALLHGDISSAFWLNPLAVTCVPLVLPLVAEDLLVGFGLRARRRFEPKPAQILTFGLLVLAYFVARNIWTFDTA